MKNEETNETREIRRICRLLTRSEMEESFLKIAKTYQCHYAIESTLRGKLEERHQKVENAQDIAEREARKAYDDLYAELVAKYGKTLSNAPLDQKSKLFSLLSKWTETVDRGVKIMQKHDNELFGEDWLKNKNKEQSESEENPSE